MSVVTTKQFVKKVFKKVAISKNNDVRIIPHIPLGTKKHKDAIEKLLKIERERENNIKFCIRPGKTDFTALLKYKSNIAEVYLKSARLNENEVLKLMTSSKVGEKGE